MNALVLVAALSCAFMPRSGALPGPVAGAAAPAYSTVDAHVQINMTSNTVLAQFKSGPATTLVSISYSPATSAVGGAGTGSYDVTDTSGTSICTVSVPCSTRATASTSCGNALTASTVYQIRNKANCSAGGAASYDNIVVSTVDASAQSYMQAMIYQVGAFAPANGIYGEFTTSPRSSTLTDLYFGIAIVGANTTGTATYDVTDTSGTALCSINVACTTLTTVVSGSTSCSASLSPSTTYQIRNKAICTGTSVTAHNITARVTTP